MIKRLKFNFLSRWYTAKTLKRSIFVPFFVFAFLFIAISLKSLYELQKSSIEGEVNFEYDNIDTMFKDKIQSEAVSLRLFVGGLSANSYLVKAIKEKDRETLQGVSTPYYEKLKSELDSDMLTYISVEGEVIVRLNLPDQYGDDWSDRFLYKKTSKTGMSYFYIESGKYSDVYLRVILPVRETSGKIEGYIVVGKKFNKILQQTAGQTHMEYLFLVKSNKLNLKRRYDSVQKNGLFKKGNDCLAVGWSSLPTEIKLPKEEIEQNLNSDSITDLKLNSGHYLSKSFILTNFDESTIGFIFALHDNSLHFDDLKKVIVNILLISVLMILVLSLVFNRILNKVEKNIYEKNLKIRLELRKRIQTDMKLVANNNELKQLTLIASHDLRSPLTNLEGLLQLLKEGNIDSKLSSEIIKNAGSSVQMMKETIDSLTTIVRQKESFTEEIELEQNIQSVFEDVILQLRYLIDEKQIEIKSDFSACPSFLVKDVHLKSILINIISNAIKYASENNEIKKFINVSTKIENGKRIIIVKDNGIGFDSEFQKDNLFKPFKRYHHEKTGSGIGLYLTKLIVEDYNGTIQMDSKIGEGTTVRIIF